MVIARFLFTKAEGQALVDVTSIGLGRFVSGLPNDPNLAGPGAGLKDPGEQKRTKPVHS
ncbi:hypothetical protein D3C80_1930750 [compost metagenome]